MCTIRCLEILYLHESYCAYIGLVQRKTLHAGLDMQSVERNYYILDRKPKLHIPSTKNTQTNLVFLLVLGWLDRQSEQYWKFLRFCYSMLLLTLFFSYFHGQNKIPHIVVSYWKLFWSKYANENNFVCQSKHILYSLLGIYNFVKSTNMHAFCYVFSSFFFIWMYSEIFVVFAFFFHLFTKCKRKAFRNKKRGWLATAFLSF